MWNFIKKCCQKNQPDQVLGYQLISVGTPKPDLAGVFLEHFFIEFHIQTEMADQILGPEIHVLFNVY